MCKNTGVIYILLPFCVLLIWGAIAILENCGQMKTDKAAWQKLILLFDQMI